jgi:hypothetical protein
VKTLTHEQFRQRCGEGSSTTFWLECNNATQWREKKSEKVPSFSDTWITEVRQVHSSDGLLAIRFTFSLLSIHLAVMPLPVGRAKSGISHPRLLQYYGVYDIVTAHSIAIEWQIHQFVSGLGSGDDQHFHFFSPLWVFSQYLSIAFKLMITNYWFVLTP